MNKECETTAIGRDKDCFDLFNCCDCGVVEEDSGCGCRGCFSCQACESCLNYSEKS